MKRRIIALMLGATITASVLAGCSESKTLDEIQNENQIRELLEFDANTNISKDDVKRFGFVREFDVKEDGYYVTFITKTFPPMQTSAAENIKITYVVDKETYFDIKNNYSSEESQKEVEMIKTLTENYDPVEVWVHDYGNIEIHQ